LEDGDNNNAAGLTNLPLVLELARNRHIAHQPQAKMVFSRTPVRTLQLHSAVAEK
jgi:hypothetical protein